MANADLESLRRTSLFAELPQAHLETLAGRAQHRSYEADQVIFRKGGPGNALFVINSGEVKISEQAPTDREVTLVMLHSGDAFGELSLLDGEPRSATATAEVDTDVLVLHRDDFLDVLEEQPAARQAVLHALAEIIRDMNRRLAETIGLDVNARLAQALLELAENHGKEHPEGVVINREVDSEDLASRTGLYPVEVDRLMRNYQYENLVRMDHGYIVLTDPDTLRSWLEPQ